MIKNMTRAEFLRGSAAMVAASMLQPPLRGEDAGRKRPNVLLVIADEWRAQAFNFRGDKNAPTSAFDNFADQCVDFTRAVSGAPLCCPSRASLMTGQYPLTDRVYLNDVELKPKGPTLGEAFAAAGYQTGYIGKWHLHGSPEGIYERRWAYVPPESRFGFEYWKAAECDHYYPHSHYYEGYDQTRQYWPGYDAIAQTESAQKFITQHAAETDPFFLVLSWGPPHFPYLAPPKYKARWENRDIHLRPNVPAESREKAIKELRGYYAAIDILNGCFGRLMQTLKETGTADDTIVVFQSDHGEMGYSQGLRRKDVPWEESIRIPFLMRYPRKFGWNGRKSDVPLVVPDIMPTLLGLAGISVPKSVEGIDWSSAIDGKSIPNAPKSSFLCMAATSGSMRSDGFAEYRGIRTERHTYVRSIKGPWLLYDNIEDPYQMKNLVDSRAMKATLSELEEELDDWLQKRGDAFLPGVRYMEEDHLTHYLEARMPITPVSDPNGQWHSTLAEGDPNELPSVPDARKILGKSFRLHSGMQSRRGA